MTIDNKKLDIINWLSSLNDEKTIQKIYDLKNESTGDWYKELSLTDKKSIDLSLQELDSGKIFTNEEVKEAVNYKISQLKTKQ